MRFSTAALAVAAAGAVAAQTTTSIQNGYAAYQYVYRVSANTQCLKTYWAAIKKLPGSTCSSFVGDVPVAASESTAGAEGVCLCAEVAYDGVTPATTLDFDAYVSCVEGLGPKNVKQGMISACRDGQVAAAASSTGGSGSGSGSGTATATSVSTSTSTSTSVSTATSTSTTTASTSPSSTASGSKAAAGFVAPGTSIIGAVVALVAMLA